MPQSTLNKAFDIGFGASLGSGCGCLLVPFVAMFLVGGCIFLVAIIAPDPPRDIRTPPRPAVRPRPIVQQRKPERFFVEPLAPEWHAELPEDEAQPLPPAEAEQLIEDAQEILDASPESGQAEDDLPPALTPIEEMSKPEYRTWTKTIQGFQTTVIAEFVKAIAEVVYLRKPDGEEIQIRVEHLGAEDQEWLEERKRAARRKRR